MPADTNATKFTSPSRDVAPSPSWWVRLCVAGRLLLSLRAHDLRAAMVFMAHRFPNQVWPVRVLRFVRWTLGEMLTSLPRVLRHVTWSPSLSRVPVWLADGNPLANHPWSENPSAVLPAEVDTVVIGAGFTGGALAYHWARHADASRVMAVLEMDDPACGASGRNAGTVVMGRYVAMVHGTLVAHWSTTRADVPEATRDRLAREFAVAYARAAYKNADLIEATVRQHDFDCDYVRTGWIQLRSVDEQEWLSQSVQVAQATGCTDWTRLSPDEIAARCGVKTDTAAGFSRGAATFHPAKWVWSLFRVALQASNVQLLTRTKVMSVEDQGDHYKVTTSRGVIRARHVVNATESYSALLHLKLHDIIRPVQTQAAYGEGGPSELTVGVSVSNSLAFMERREAGTLFGSDETPLPDRLAGNNRPSRFVSAVALSEIHRYFPNSTLRVTHEWSGTVGFTPDQYPVVGLLDGKRQYIIGGMCGSGTGVSFNAGRCIVNRILARTTDDDDYPPEYFAPSRLLDPQHHPWPTLSSLADT